MKRLLSALVLFACLHQPTVQAQLPPFQHQELLSGLSAPSSMAILPNERILITTLAGQVFITSPLGQAPMTYDLYLDLIGTVDNSAEHGLIEVVLDPNFANNNYIYLYYSTLSSKNRLSRFIHLGDSAAELSETVVFETYDQYSSCCHTGGSVVFANDGSIMVCVGDDYQPNLSQDLTSSYGKVHRMNPDGSIPVDNPFYDTTPGLFNAGGLLKSIYAYGLRNPFRGGYDGPTGKYLVGEVGGNDHAIAWEDLHLIEPGANFGWPDCGDIGRDPDGGCTDPLYVDPVFTYPHAGSGASITGGLTYRGSMFPPEWQGRYFYGDFVRGWVRYLEFDSTGQVISDEPFIDQAVFGGIETTLAVKFVEGPDGAIYYVSLYDDFVNFTGSLHRIFYTADLAPICDSVQVAPTSGAGPQLLVNMQGWATDPEGQPLSYSWVFGDGSPDFNGSTTSHTYNGNGTYNAKLLVSDTTSTVICANVPIFVGQAPLVSITSPMTGTTFQAGQVVSFTGTVSDDGPIGPADMVWTVVFNHDTHVHPEIGTSGTNQFDLFIPSTGHGFTGNTWYTITLSVTDADGLTSSTSVVIYPEKVNVTFTSDPPGLEVIVNGLPYLTPYTLDQVIGMEVAVSVPNAQQCIGSDGYLFSSWSDGGAFTHFYYVPAVNDTLQANFSNNGGCGHCGKAVDLDGIDDVLGLDSLTLTGDLTIEFWMDADPGMTINDVILGNEDDLSVDLKDGKLHCASSSEILHSSVSLQPNQWYHIALVRSGADWSVFINGVYDAAATTIPFSGPVTITRFGQGIGPGRYDGSLDDIRIWGLARSLPQVNAYKDIPVTQGTPGLLANWNFDQSGALQLVNDISGNDHHLSLGSSVAPNVDDPTIFLANSPLNLTCERNVGLDLHAWLEGPFDVIGQLMRDDLRVAGLIPTSEPFTALGMYTGGAAGTNASANVFNVTGPNAIVDWVLVELRNGLAPSEVEHVRIGFIQRDGDIVGTDGVSPLQFLVDRPRYKVALRHRNHLGIMAQNQISFGVDGTVTSLDLRSPGTLVYGNSPRKNVQGYLLLWTGNSKLDSVLKYVGPQNDRDAIIAKIGGLVPTNVVAGYFTEDVNLDGKAKYAGQNNDRDIVLQNIGGAIPTAIRQEQLP